MKPFSFVALFLFVFVRPSLADVEWLDMTIPPLQISGTLLEVVEELHKHVPVRICLEDVNLGSASSIEGISLDVKNASLKEILDRIAKAHPDLGWRTTYFLMCPIIHIFRYSSYSDPRNPLNVTVAGFVLKDNDLYDLMLPVYGNSSDFRNAINPGRDQFSVAASQIRGVSLTKHIDIRYTVDMSGVSVRELLDGLACISFNGGLSWYFWYDSKATFPNNFALRRF